MMWNFGGEKADSNKLRMPSPSFPVAQHFTGSGPMHSSSSHIGGANFPATYISPAPEPYNQVPRAAFPQHGSGPQIIHIYTKKHHSSHSHHQHRPHRSHSRPPPITYPVPQIAVAQPDHHQIVHHTPSRPVQSNSRPPKSNYLVPAQAPPELNSDFQYSKCTGRKKALCVGINYIGQPNALRGCINDARHVRDFLIQKEGYKAGDIVLLTDDAKNPRDIPTRKNILDAMAWLVRSARTNDSLFFHYSGHGGQTKDKDGDETDGFDEVIFPLDFKKAGHIVDDLMHEIMVKPLPPGCRLTALFDSCHSGTVLDLPYIYSSHGRLRGGHVSNKSHAQKATRADVISWSGCKDGQTSADTFAGGVAVGAMSYAFITALTRQPNQTYQQLLRSIRLILYPKFEQKPQLGSSHHIDTNLQFII